MSSTITPAAQTKTSNGQGHPLPETLRAYQKGSLPEEEMDKIRDHLVFCATCSETVLDLAAFFSDTPRKGRLDPDELVEAWHELVETLDHAER